MYISELELAITAVKEAGKILANRASMHIDSSIGKDLKLSKDKESEKKIIEVLSAHSDYSILSEENGLKKIGDDSMLWIVDPLDGTVNYFRNITELSCISIALYNNRQPVLGVIYRFIADELYYGELGKGAFCNGIPIKTSHVELVQDAMLATGLPVNRDYSNESLSTFVKQSQCFKKVRMLGSAALMGAFVAAGRFDVYCEDNIMIWDIAAAAAIVKAAGGEVYIKYIKEDTCICKLFANNILMEDYNDKKL